MTQLRHRNPISRERRLARTTVGAAVLGGVALFSLGAAYNTAQQENREHAALDAADAVAGQSFVISEGATLRDDPRIMDDVNANNQSTVLRESIVFTNPLTYTDTQGDLWIGAVNEGQTVSLANPDAVEWANLTKLEAQGYAYATGENTGTYSVDVTDAGISFESGQSMPVGPIATIIHPQQ